MMKKTLMGTLLCFFAQNSFIFADVLGKALEENKEGNWTRFKFKYENNTPEVQEESVDFQAALNSTLSSAFEKNNGIDQTEGNLDFQNENFQMKNLTSLYEGENDSLLFQKEIFVSQESYNYSGGLINRYMHENFLFGVNGFIDKHKEENSDSSNWGAEFGYTDTLKAYTNYYMPQDKSVERNLQLGLSFVVPSYESVIFDVSKDNEKANYQITYKPYKVLNFNLFQSQNKEDEIQNAVRVGFNFSLNKSFLRQLKEDESKFEEINRYDFFQRNR
ncbi:inverse autotransporter beta domain-containing protein [Campylobacter upsaliensis]|uniref:inverse autotransporter beta domain-containing protein n=1 Tax=Campylobacter upsaliensis TaxID=28080 RepID=UPI002B3E0E18|nr:inverse autotransporter beta domain-containing protein [Campylobacter upsaliensis]MEB2816434.1 inverse autotransporter beta domain-containing protein [Campylobacter upsaliensis]